ncbi:MAG: hypothetical protein WC789_07060 [Lentisphaeria bacterium]
MIHRLVHQVVKTGMNAFLADARMVDDLFTELFALPVEEVESIRTYLQSHTLRVVNGYPRVDVNPPLVAIILSQEGEDEHFLGYLAGMVDEDGDPAMRGAEVQGSSWKHTFQLPVVTEHPDVTAAYYEALKTVLIAGIPTLVEGGCWGFQLSGAELAPDPRYIPEGLFVRQLTLSLNAPFLYFNRASALGKAFQVSGLHVDRSGSPSDPGAVKTNIGVFAEGEDE